MRSTLVPVTTTIVVGLLVAACASSPSPAPVTTPPSTLSPLVSTLPSPSATNPTGTPIAGIEHATGPTDVVLQFDSGPDDSGPDVSPLYGFRPGPEFTLYGDGTVIFRNERGTPPPAEGPIIRGRPFMIAHLSEDQIQALLRFALGEGGLGNAHQRYDTRSGNDFDDRFYSIFTIRAGGLDKRVEVVGANDPFEALADHLRNFDGEGEVSTNVWVPDRYWGLLSGPDLSRNDEVPWPWPGIAPGDFDKPTTDPCASSGGRRDMSKEEASVVGLSNNGGVVQKITLYYRGPDCGGLYRFSLWPILPDETSPPIPDPTPAPTPTPTPSPLMTPGPLRIDGFARVVVDRLRVRSAPAISAASERLEPLLDTGTMLFVIEGPVAGSAYDWYRVTTFGDGHDLTGWVASAARDGTPWISGVRPDCPDPRAFTDDVDALQRLGSMVALSCYGDTTLQFRAEQASSESGGEMYVDERLPSWLLDYHYFTYWAPPTPDDPEVPNGGAFETALDPSRFPTDSLSTPPGSVWDVIGHFDDAAAKACRVVNAIYANPLDPQAIILGCRATFVVTDVVSVDRYAIDLRSSEPEGTIAAGTTATFSATVSPIGPAGEGAIVRFEIYREDSGAWRIAARRDVAADATGQASLPWTFVTTGSQYVRAKAPANATHAASAWSLPVRYTAR